MAIIPRGAGGSGGGSSVTISTATPQPLGTAAAGSTGEVSDAGHVHAAPTQAYTDTTLSTASATGWTTRDGEGQEDDVVEGPTQGLADAIATVVDRVADEVG